MMCFCAFFEAQTYHPHSLNVISNSM